MTQEAVCPEQPGAGTAAAAVVEGVGAGRRRVPHPHLAHAEPWRGIPLTPSPTRPAEIQSAAVGGNGSTVRAQHGGLWKTLGM